MRDSRAGRSVRAVSCERLSHCRAVGICKTIIYVESGRNRGRSSKSGAEVGGRNVFKFAVKWVYSQIERKIEREILIGKEREIPQKMGKRLLLTRDGQRRWL